MHLFLKPRFSRLFEKLSEDVQCEALEKMTLFKEPKNHKTLHVHPLQGKFKGCFAFSVNFQFRIVFQYEDNKRTVILLAIGDHDVYR